MTTIKEWEGRAHTNEIYRLPLTTNRIERSCDTVNSLLLFVLLSKVHNIHSFILKKTKLKKEEYKAARNDYEATLQKNR